MFFSHYLNAKRFKAADPRAGKQAVVMLHELLNLTMEKKMASTELDAFHEDYRLPSKLLTYLCIRGSFYIADKGVIIVLLMVGGNY